MNDKKPLVDFRSAPKLQTSLILSGALSGFFGAQGGITVLTVLGIVLILASGAVWSLYYRCPHCGAWVADEPEPEEKKKIQHKKKKH